MKRLIVSLLLTLSYSNSNAEIITILGGNIAPVIKSSVVPAGADCAVESLKIRGINRVNLNYIIDHPTRYSTEELVENEPNPYNGSNCFISYYHQWLGDVY